MIPSVEAFPGVLSAMVIPLVLAVSLILQIVAALLALRLVRITGWRWSWMFIAAAITLMAARRSITLFQMVGESSPSSTTVEAELVALLISILMLVGIASIGPLFQALRRSEQALRESEERYRSVTEDVLNAAEVGLALMDRALHVVWVNRRWEELFGCSRAEAVGASMRQIAAQWVGPAFEKPDDVAERLATTYEPGAGETGFEACLRARGGEQARWLVHRSLPIGRGHFHGGRLELWWDVTALKRAQEERETVLQRAQEAQHLESLGVLASGIAHDFNNLLTSVLGHASLAVEEAGPDAAVRERLQQVERAARRAAEIVAQLLLYAGRGDATPEEVDLNALIREMGDLLQAGAAKGARIRYDLQEDLPPVTADPAQLRQVVLNMITNAAEAVDGPGGTVTVETRVTGAGPGRQVELVFRDNGCGLDPETKARIFEPFFTTKSAGRGLGLAAVRGIVRAHGGDVEVSSSPGLGTEFVIRLPASAEPGQGVPAEGESPRAGSLPRGATVLVVDDDEAVRRVACGMLEQAGLGTLEAGGGAEALAILRVRGQDVAAVLLDRIMPGMDGLAVLEEVRRSWPDLPILLMSGLPEPDIEAAVASRRAVGFLRKPFSFAELVRAVEGAMAGRMAEPPPA